MTFPLGIRQTGMVGMVLYELLTLTISHRITIQLNSFRIAMTMISVHMKLNVSELTARSLT